MNAATPEPCTTGKETTKRKLLTPFTLIALAMCAFLIPSSSHAQTQSPSEINLDRTNLPIPEPWVVPITILDARDAKAPPRFAVTAPKGAPNVVIVLIDDFGFGHSSAFGGPIHMPTLEKLAAKGLKYNRFHTTALCSPTRVALLTGRNHHVNNAAPSWNWPRAFPVTPASARKA